MVSKGVEDTGEVHPILVDADGRVYVIGFDPASVAQTDTIATHPDGLGVFGRRDLTNAWREIPVAAFSDGLVNKADWVIPVTPVTAEKLEGTKITDGTTTGHFDPETGGLTTSRAIHRRISQSNMWMCSYRKVDLANATSFHLHLMVGAAKNMHMTYNVFVEGRSQVYFTEDPTLTNNGTELTEHNFNRQTPTAATGTVYRDPAITVVGTIIETSEIGNLGHFTAAGGQLDSGSYWMLEKGESYLIWVYNDSGAVSDVVVQVMWHEE